MREELPTAECGVRNAKNVSSRLCSTLSVNGYLLSIIDSKELAKGGTGGNRPTPNDTGQPPALKLPQRQGNQPPTLRLRRAKEKKLKNLATPETGRKSLRRCYSRVGFPVETGARKLLLWKL